MQTLKNIDSTDGEDIEEKIVERRTLTPANIDLDVQKDYKGKIVAKEESMGRDLFRIRDVSAPNLVNKFSLIQEILDNYVDVAIYCDFPGVAMRLVGDFEKSMGRDLFKIRKVWDPNLEEEFALIRATVDEYPYVAVYSEFPGVVMRPVGDFKNTVDYNYQALKGNVNISKLIQLGFTFSDEKGNFPTDGTGKYLVWQFNFRGFDLTKDVYASESIDLLKQSEIDFEKNNNVGIDLSRFGELLMSSGIVLNDEIRWVTFHGGYDFGYLLKVLTGRRLPDTLEEFLKLASVFFPVVYDIKYLMKFCDRVYGGLNKLAELLGVEMIDTCHQAGTRSLLACHAFMKMKDKFFNGSPEKYAGVLHGLVNEED
ncbi:hypothetical protein Nepgr_008894 [Nepenthes gracilis]|uniref:poly(A)-specific ribonuclease n=1 Tax=Nepenthes gracilis TaxID=150966 RepID=A0AAD3S9Y1_NEPGR|nr:hypothetical protein Nepgr_008894 [Nepenthes gracilis]